MAAQEDAATAAADCGGGDSTGRCSPPALSDGSEGAPRAEGQGAPHGGNGDDRGDNCGGAAGVDARRRLLARRLRHLDQEIAVVEAAVEAATAEHDDEGAGAAAAAGDLHGALGKERLRELRSRRRLLSERLRLADEAPGGGGGGAGRRPRQTVSFAEDAPPAALQPAFAEPAVTFSGEGATAGKGAGDDHDDDDDDFDRALDAAASGMVETERDRLIRTGVLTPFAGVQGFERGVQGPGDGPAAELDLGFSASAEAEAEMSAGADAAADQGGEEARIEQSAAATAAAMKRLRESRPRSTLLEGADVPRQEPLTREFRRLRRPLRPRQAGGEDGDKGGVSRGRGRRAAGRARRPLPEGRWRRRRRRPRGSSASGSEEEEEDTSDAEQQHGNGGPLKKPRRVKQETDEDRSAEDFHEETMTSDAGSTDDSNQEDGQAHTSVGRQSRERKAAGRRSSKSAPADEDEEDVVLEGGLRIPGRQYGALFDYQRTGVKWLWELHCQRAGGIIGDEMGLGKTVQLATFLGALHHSRVCLCAHDLLFRSGMYQPSMVVCPVTLLRQWRRELRLWYPHFRVKLLHESALPSHLRSGGGQPKGTAAKRPQQRPHDDSEDSRSSGDEDGGSPAIKGAVLKGARRWDAMIDSVVHSRSGILVTTYEQLRLVRDRLLDVPWGYVVLDEGHKIRNPDAEVTLVCKQVQTVHRIIMTGAPIQNRLTELWSLFDFVFPGKLGTLPVFKTQFALPISIGGYANATPLQVSTAYKCAVVLRDLIMPYLLRRVKTDVEAHLPKKTEQVLFCSLTGDQRATYRAFLGSSEVEQIFEGQRNALYGIDVLRKICNHPDLLEREHSAAHEDYGNPARSGKLQVVMQILPLWKRQGHRVLLFTQTQQMLDILESCMIKENVVYRRMDGNTPVRQRMALIDEFNQGQHVFIFILTTKVGGLGTNLVGANRVIIYDPDWNPSTDVQARERAWRIGQTRDVTVYRLITRGTIEEKVYHRQIYKQFLTNRILKDPRQKRFFKAKDMTDLFTLGNDDEREETETSTIFAETVGSIDLGVRASQPTSTSTEGKQDDVFTKAGEKEEEQKHQRNKSLRARGRQKDTGIAAEAEASPKKRSRKLKEEAGEEPPEPGQEDDGRILRSLFEASGIHSALDHDAIVSLGGTSSASDTRQVDLQARQVAQQASEALRRSRLARASDNVALPTWTGRSGAAGGPSTVRQRFGAVTHSQLAAGTRQQADVGSGPMVGSAAGTSAGRALTSAELLARVRRRRQGAELAAASSTANSHPGGGGHAASMPARASLAAGPTDPQALARKIRTFLEERGGRVASADVAERFRHEVSAQDTPLFRRLLRQEASLEGTGPGGHNKEWLLRSSTANP
eukprot:SM000098S25136  [mRNA]  locus=s98:436376:442665:+ [translate_table: standard]